MIKQATILLISGMLLFACSTRMHTARIILLPDVQYYVEKYPEVLDSQINWIVRNAKDIDFVLQQGDITQNNSEREWQIARNAFSRLDHFKPYVLALGNHDMGSADGKFADTRDTKLYNKFFPYSVVSKLPGFAGSFETDKTDNSYFLIKSGKINWLVLSLEFGPRDEVLQWADGIVSKYPNHLVILNTHSYMYSDSTRQGPGDSWRPQAYGVGKDKGDSSVNDGEQIWNKLVRKHANIRFVFSGHILNTGIGTLISINDHGNYVYQMLANYQSEVKGNPNGGNGWLRILDMDFKKKILKVTTYSPFVNQYKEEPGQSFVIRNVLY